MEIGYNEDLTTAIFLRLPAKSVLRFKTVSKQWLSIVSSPRFRQIHAASNAAATANTGLFFNKGNSLKFVSLGNHSCPIPNSDQPMEILSSSGGLLLLLLQSRDYCICNPTTKEIKPLAAVVPQVIIKSRCGVARLAFDPSKSLHYNVLFVYYDKNSYHNFSSMIYSSESRTFRLLKTNFNHLPCDGIYWNDAIHWTGSRRKLVYFDLSKECILVHRLPNSISGYLRYIAEYQGHLLVVICDRDEFCKLFSVVRVYELKRDYSGWSSLKYEVNLASFGIQCSPHLYDIRMFGVVADEEQELSMVILLRDRTFVGFNLKKKLIKKVLPPRAHVPWYRCYGYKETLACV